MRLLIALALAAACAGPAHAQLRAIPQDAKRGEIRHLQDMLVEIDGAVQRLAPGAQVRDPANRLVLPTAIPAGAVVRYLVDASGMVHRIWILTAEEAAKR